MYISVYVVYRLLITRSHGTTLASLVAKVASDKVASVKVKAGKVNKVAVDKVKPINRITPVLRPASPPRLQPPPRKSVG